MNTEYVKSLERTVSYKGPKGFIVSVDATFQIGLAVIRRSLGLDLAPPTVFLIGRHAGRIPSAVTTFSHTTVSLTQEESLRLGLGGCGRAGAEFFSFCPLALNCSLSFNFPLCIKHIGAKNGQMYSVWEDDPRQL